MKMIEISDNLFDDIVHIYESIPLNKQHLIKSGRIITLSNYKQIDELIADLNSSHFKDFTNQFLITATFALHKDRQLHKTITELNAGFWNKSIYDEFLKAN